MIRLLKAMGLLGILILIFTLSSSIPVAKETTIYIVRHAEKETSDPKNNNPELNKDGKQRALALKKFLKKEKISAVFSTNYKRTMQTAAPIAQHNGLPVKTYEAKDPKGLVKLVKAEFTDQEILVVGHSNTILELVKAFGLQTPVDKLNDDDYDLLFIVTLYKNGEPGLQIKRFGKSHHSTEIAVSKKGH